MSGLADADVEGLARALGVWLGHTNVENLNALFPAICRTVGGGYSFEHGEPVLVENDDGSRSCSGNPRARVDTPTAALLLLGHARGLRLDLGECRACRERGSMHEEASSTCVNRHFWRGGDVALDETLRDLLASGLQPKVEHEDDDGWIVVAYRPCPACTVDGKPTGRESLDWATALAWAMPEPPCCSGIDCGCYGLPTPGDADTREALGVLADQLQAAGDPFGVWLTAWLLDDGGAALAGYLGDIGASVRAETDRLAPAPPSVRPSS